LRCAQLVPINVDAVPLELEEPRIELLLRCRGHGSEPLLEAPDHERQHQKADSASGADSSSHCWKADRHNRHYHRKKRDH
jgi:hypothetical protein